MSFKKIASIGAGLVVAVSAALVISIGGNASAISCYKYDPNGFETSKTPVFNNICGISGVTSTTNGNLSSTDGTYPLGDETDFVRIRQNTSNSPLGSSNPKLVNNLTSACGDGTNYDIWTYVHNDAEADYNDNGNGSAVAHNVKLAMSAPVNTTGTHFSFGSTVSASNAASVSDSASLSCNGQPVELTMVPSAVYYNTDLSQTAYGQLPDSAVNGTTALGSPTMGSGNQWGCWQYRIVVVYRVTVHKKQQPPQATAMCDMFNITASEDKKVKVSAFKYTAENANFKNVVLNWGDNSSNSFNNANVVVGQEHQYKNYGTYLITAVVSFDENGKTVTSGGAGTACAEQVTFTPNQPPQVTPPTPTGASGGPAPTSLVNTGPGSAIAAFVAATIAGAVAYRQILARRMSRQ